MKARLKANWFRGNLALAAAVAAALLAHGANAQALGEREEARAILDATGVRGGLVVHLGCGDGRLTAALRAADNLLVHGLDADAVKVAAARKHIQSLGLYGKVSAETFDGATLPYTDNLVNLLVAENPGDAPRAEIMRVLCPNGIAYIKEGGKWTKTIKPRPGEIDEWTHFLHSASNNAVAKDSVVGPPKRFQWLAGPKWARSHDHLATVSAVVSTGGRLFYIIDEAPTAAVAISPRWSLVARDAFNGVLLWKREISSWEGHLRDFRSGPTELARRLVAVGDRVYVTLGYGQPVSALDAASGETVKTYAGTDNALEIIWHDGALFVVAGDRVPDNTDGAAKPVNPEKIWHWWPIYEETPPRKRLVAVRADSGAPLWEKTGADTTELMPTTLAAAGKRVFFQSHQEVLALDAASGAELWRAPRPVNRLRPSWSAPTLVVYGEIVLSGDRAVDTAAAGSPPTDKPSQWVVNSMGGHAPQGQLIGFSAKTGERLWESDIRESYNSPPDVLVADGLIWSGNLVVKKEPGITTGRDPLTGKVARERPKDQEFYNLVMSHHRCYRNKATEKDLVLGRDGIEFIDLKTGKGFDNEWVRGACQYGVLPCNGLIYAPPHSCACHVESLLPNFNALAPEGEIRNPKSEIRNQADRPEHGPAYGKIVNRQSEIVNQTDWPTYRHDASRSGSGASVAAAGLKQAWSTEIPGGRISSPVVADGKVFVASIDQHAVRALDAADGKLQWSYTAGGRVDSPPTIHGGTAIFGCADGWIYCLRAADGVLAWRFRAASNERRIVAYGQLESPWPVPGSTLVQDGVVLAVAGRSTYLDGGMRLLRLDAKTGKQLSETPISGKAKPDVLSSDGASVYLRHRRFDVNGAELQGGAPHLYSPAGFLEGSWWHRTYWMVGAAMRSGWDSWPSSGQSVPAGRIMALDDDSIYGFGRFNQYHRDGSHVGLGNARYLLYAAARTPPDAPKKKGAPPKVASRWSTPVPLLARGMLLSGETLFLAGPPDLLEYPKEKVADTYHITSAKSIAEHAAALDGKKGALLWAVSTKDGEKLAEYPLDAAPVWDGLAAANGRLYLSATNGKVVCLR